ncbi:MAG TPA: c-type cytochrome [Rhodanobacter sp.]
MLHLLKPSRAFLGLFLGVAVPLLLHTADSHAADIKMPEGEAKARASNCFSCHAVDQKLVGPAYQEVAKRYASQGDAIVATLVKKVKVGGAGNWGDVPMSAHPELSDADTTLMVKWILSLNGSASTAATTAGTKAATPPAATHTYKDTFGKPVQTDVAVFTGADQKAVTPAVFSGYEQYNSYCFRCHGGDAIGGEYAPDLRKSLSGDMTYEQFLSTAMTGRVDKGMPSWAGFFEPKDIQAIYDYIKARQLNLIPGGRPPSG